MSVPLGRKKIDSAASRLLLSGGQYVVGKGLLPNANLERVKKPQGRHGPNKNQQHPQFQTRTKMFFLKKRFRLCIMVQCMAGEKAARREKDRVYNSERAQVKVRPHFEAGHVCTHTLFSGQWGKKKDNIDSAERERAACIFGASQWMTKSSVRKDIATTRATCSGWGAILWFFFLRKACPLGE